MKNFNKRLWSSKLIGINRSYRFISVTNSFARWLEISGRMGLMQPTSASLRSKQNEVFFLTLIILQHYSHWFDVLKRKRGSHSPIIVDNAAGFLHAFLDGCHALPESLLHSFSIERRATLAHIPAVTYTHPSSLYSARKPHTHTRVRVL